MSERTDELQANLAAAEQELYQLQAEKDRVLEDYRNRLKDMQQRAADAQKELCDHEAASALLDRPDGEDVARSLGLTLPGSE
jgi:hypothetical protein